MKTNLISLVILYIRTFIILSKIFILKPFKTVILGAFIFIFYTYISPVFFIMDASAQNALRDIPSPDPQIQMDMFQAADGLEVSLFASEPMVSKPIQMNWDAEGRLWVVSSTVYPHIRPGETANDKIYILEDTTGDGKADNSTVFAEGLNTPTGILPGDGGVYVANSTEILHLMDTDGDGKADQKRQVLTGFGTGDTHHLIHTFRWGPDGLMYFNQSIYIYSHVETPFGIRRLEGGGVWQLNPKTLELKVFAKGLINPWGLQFDHWGGTFLTDGAGTEGINYAFPGATFVTAPGAERIIRGLNPGQPKHSGLDIISGSHFPEAWDGSLITNDFRANRVNRFKLEEQGSGFVSKQQDDLLWTDHIAFRPVDILQGPDGAIYVADWYNPIIQHGEVDFHDPRRDRENGRIWRIAAENSRLNEKKDLKGATIEELLTSLQEPEAWIRIQAKQLLKSFETEKVITATQKWINELADNGEDYEHHLMEGLWVFQMMGVKNEALLKTVLNTDNSNARAAALRVMQHWIRELEEPRILLEKYIVDPHPRVRLETLIALGKLASAESAKISLKVLDKPMDEYLDYALWQSLKNLEPYWLKKVMVDPGYFQGTKKTTFALKSTDNPTAMAILADLYQKGHTPDEYQNDVLGTLAKFGTNQELNLLFSMAINGQSIDNASRKAQLNALIEAKQQRNLTPDGDLGQIGPLIHHDDEQLAIAAIRLSGLWNRSELNLPLAKLVEEGNVNIKKEALLALATMEDQSSHQLLASMTGKGYPTPIRILATSQWVTLDPVAASETALNLFKSNISSEEAIGLFAAFLTNKNRMAALFNQLSDNEISETMAKAGRQAIQQHLPWYRQDDKDTQALKKTLAAYGGVLPPERMPQQLNDNQVVALAQEVKIKANPELGEAIYRRKNLACQTCHAIGGAGGLIGPDLSSLGTSSPIDNIIRSLVDPAETIKEGYELQKITRTNGSILMGYLANEGKDDLTIRNVAGTEISVPKSQIAEHGNVPGSLMPPGLTASLEREEFINLVAYLSKLGTTGDYRVPNERMVRRWRLFPANEKIQKIIQENGLEKAILSQEFSDLVPNYSKASGALPLDEIDILEGENGQKLSILKFELEVLREGSIELVFNATQGLMGWVGKEPLEFSNEGTMATLPYGLNTITLAIDRDNFPGSTISIQLADRENATAQTRLVLGR
ncbi:MAG: PVC-type heme-binding CxxCH protein [Cyclobacteriaceae bacterium]